MYKKSIDARSSFLFVIAIDKGNRLEWSRGFGHAPLSSSFLQTPLKFFLTAKCNGVSSLLLCDDGFAPRFRRLFTRTCTYKFKIKNIHACRYISPFTMSKATKRSLRNVVFL